MAGLPALRYFTQAVPVIQKVYEKVLEVARDVVKAGSVVVRPLLAQDLGLTDWKLDIPAGNTDEVTYINNFTVPERKAIGFYGILLESEDTNVHTEYVAVYIGEGGTSRIRIWDLKLAKDGSDAGKVVYLPLNETLVVKEGTKITIKVRAVNEDSANPHPVRIVLLGWVGEPEGYTLIRG